MAFDYLGVTTAQDSLLKPVEHEYVIPQDIPSLRAWECTARRSDWERVGEMRELNAVFQPILFFDCQKEKERKVKKSFGPHPCDNIQRIPTQVIWMVRIKKVNESKEPK